MAMSTLLRSSCRLAAVPKFPALNNVARLSSCSVLNQQNTANGKTKTMATGYQFSPLLTAVNSQMSLTRSSPTTQIRHSSHGNHATLWNVERALSLALLGVCPLAFIAPSQVMDSLLAVSMVMHQHWGLEAIVIDYVRPIVFGNAIPKVALGLLYLLSVGCLGGLFYFIYHDIGIVNTIKRMWAIGEKH